MSKPLVRNIYYMLSYAFQVLREDCYKDVETEQFDNVADLCAGILVKGISMQVRQGLHKEYVPRTEPLSAIKGHFEFSESVNTQSLVRNQLVCTYDEFSENALMNQVLKTTSLLLIADNSGVAEERRAALRKLMFYFARVDTVDLHSINWNLQYNRNNRNYQMMVAICFLVYRGLLQTQQDGTTHLMDFFDEQRMCHLYEKFLLEYCRDRYKGKLTVSSPEIPWQLDEESIDMDLLPKMQSDVLLSDGTAAVIVDAKYYSNNLQHSPFKKTVINNNLYQIKAYVSDYAGTHPGKKVGGMLLYAKTDYELQPHLDIINLGHRIVAHTVDLNKEWKYITEELDEYARLFFPNIS